MSCPLLWRNFPHNTTERNRWCLIAGNEKATWVSNYRWWKTLLKEEKNQKKSSGFLWKHISTTINFRSNCSQWSINPQYLRIKAFVSKIFSIILQRKIIWTWKLKQDPDIRSFMLLCDICVIVSNRYWMKLTEVSIEAANTEYFTDCMLPCR